MNIKFARNTFGITLFGLLFLTNWSAAPVHSTTVVTPPGIVRALLLGCQSNNEPDCNRLRVQVIVPEPCIGPSAGFRFIVRGGASPYEVSVTGPDGNSVVPLFTMNDGSDGTFESGQAGLFTVNVIDRNGCKAKCTNSTISCCSITQEGYGDSQFQFNGESSLEIIDSLISPPPTPTVGGLGPLTLGLSGMGIRSLTFEEGSEGCINQRLPASGIPTALPAGLGHATINASTCQTSPPLPLENSKFLNTLLGQTIALSLNTRLDNDLGSLFICNTMITRKALSRELDGFVGGYGDGRDADGNVVRASTDAIDPNAPVRVVTIPTTVTAALAALGLPRTVDGLRMLANRALAGDSNLGGASLHDINAAVSAINTAFDHCAFLTECFNVDVCLQDSSSGDVLSLNLATGDYQFTRCGAAGFTISGKGTVRSKGNTLSLEHNSADRRVVAQVDTSVRRGTAAVQLFSLSTTFTITDRNTADNACTCP